MDPIITVFFLISFTLTLMHIESQNSHPINLQNTYRFDNGISRSMQFGGRLSDDLSSRRTLLADQNQPHIRANNAPPPADQLDPDDNDQGRDFANRLINDAGPIERRNVDIPDEPEENFQQAHAENRAQNLNRQINIAPPPQLINI